MTIPLTNIIRIERLSEYKVHFAMKEPTTGTQPLDDFLQSAEAWKGWQEGRGATDRFSRTYILTLIDYYPQDGTWLFGGIFKVLERHDNRYTVELLRDSEEYIGRLLVSFEDKVGRNRYRYLERCYEQLTVDQVWKSAYHGEPFPGFDNIAHDFWRLEQIVIQGNTAWKTALENIKGVYLVYDKANGKKYVGSAYGESGIWSRWSSYIQTGHGWTDELTTLIAERGKEYAQMNFRMSLLEYMPMKTEDKKVRSRETHWKSALVSSSKLGFGYNRN